MNFAPVSSGRAAVLPFKPVDQIRFGHEGHDHDKPAATPEKPATPETTTPAAASKKKPGLLRNPLGLLILGLLGVGGYQGYQAVKSASQPTAASCQAEGGTFVTKHKFSSDGTSIASSESKCIPKGQPIDITVGVGERLDITVPVPKEVQDLLKGMQQQPK